MHYWPFFPFRSGSACWRFLVLFLVVTAAAAPISPGKEVAYEHYDTPLYEQIVQRMRDKIAARLGNSPLNYDRYFIVPFAYQNKGNAPEFSHSFITVIRVFGRGKEPPPGSEYKRGRYRDWEFEAFTISWLPADFLQYPNLCVFSGFGARLLPRLNQCPISTGRNFNLEQTIKLAVNARVAVGMWGPYEIKRPGFDLAVDRKRLLETGTIKYRADDRLYLPSRTAINCFNAMSNLDEPFPRGGAFGTGFKMWGLNGTARVLIEYTARANRRHLLLEPVDVKRDRYGFVYAPARDADRDVYNPFVTASAYRR